MIRQFSKKGTNEGKDVRPHSREMQITTSRSACVTSLAKMPKPDSVDPDILVLSEVVTEKVENRITSLMWDTKKHQDKNRYRGRGKGVEEGGVSNTG